jgi:hypothetical protein
MFENSAKGGGAAPCMSYGKAAIVIKLKMEKAGFITDLWMTVIFY